MREDLLKAIEEFNVYLENPEVNFIPKLLEYVPDLIVDEELDENKLIESRDLLFSIFFPYLVKYDAIELAKFVHENNMYDENADMFTLLFSREFNSELLKLQIKDKGIDFVKGNRYLNSDSIDYLMSLGYSAKEIYQAMDSDSYLYYLYTKDESIVELIKFNFYTDLDIIVDEFLKGRKELFQYVIEPGGYGDKKRFEKFIRKLVLKNSFNADEIYKLMQLYVENYEEYMSVIDDEELIRQMVKVGGDKSILFASVLPDDVIEHVDIDYNEYKVINGKFKNSSKLMEKFISMGNKDAILYANSDAINASNVHNLDGFSLDEISASGRLLTNPYVIKYCIQNGYDIEVGDIDDLLTNVEVFELIVDLCKKYNIKKGWLWDKPFEFVSDFALGEIHGRDNYSFSGISNDVANHLINNCISIDTYIYSCKSNEVIDRLYCEKGHYEVLLKINSSYELNRKYEENVTYEMYNDLITKYPDLNINSSYIYKFIREGHYELLEKCSNHVRESLNYLDDLGLDNLTYEEYLKSNSYIRELPALKSKFADMEVSITEVSKEDLLNNPMLLLKRVEAGLSYEEFSSIVADKRSMDIDKKIVLYYLKQGHIGVVDNVYFYEVDQEIFDEYIKQLNIRNELPSQSVLNNREFGKKLFQYYIEKKDYRILNLIDSLYSWHIDLIMKSDYSLDDYLKNPILSFEIIEKLINSENKKEIINAVKLAKSKQTSFYISGDLAKVIIAMYRNGWDMNTINELCELANIDSRSKTVVVNLFKELNEEEYKIFETLKVNDLFQNKLITDSLLYVLSKERIIEALKYTNEEMKCYIIRKMVDLGHNEFISYYSNVFDDDVLKKSLMSGYFPDSKALSNLIYKKHIMNLDFSLEELNYLKTRIDNNPMFVIYFNDIVDNKAKLREYVLKEPLIIMFFEEEYKYDFTILDALYKKYRNVFYVIISANDYDVNKLVEFYLTGNYDIGLFPYNKVNEDIVLKLIDKYPNIIDKVHNVSNDIVVRAVKNGYVINDNTDSKIIVQMLIEGKIKFEDSKYLEKLHYYDIGKVISNISFDSYLSVSNIIDKLILENMYVNKNSYNLISYINSASDENLKDELLFKFDLYNWLYRLEDKTLDENVKRRIYENLIKFGYNSVYVKSNGGIIRNVLGDDFLASKFLSDLDFPICMMYELKDISDANREKIKEKFLSNIENYKQDKTQLDEVIKWFYFNGYMDESHKLAVEFFDNDPMFYAKYIKEPSSELLAKITNLLKDYPDFIDMFDISIEDKDLMIYLLKKGKYSAYLKCKNDLIYDKEICLELIKIDAYNISYIPIEQPNYKELCILALNKSGYLYRTIIEKAPNYANDKDIIKAALVGNPNIIFELDENIYNKEYINYIENFDYLNIGSIPKNKINDFLDVFNERELSNIVYRNVFDYFINADFKDELINHPLIVKTIKYNFNDKNLFRKIISLVREKGVMEYLDEETKEVVNDALEILNSTGKVNTLDKNPMFTFDLVKYIYPNMGLSFTLDVMKYNTGADRQIIDAINNGDIDLIKYYYDLVINSNMFENNDKIIHYAFRHFDTIKDLISDIKSKGIILSNEDYINLKNVILRNRFDINNYNDLKNYNIKMKNEIDKLLLSNDINAIKKYLAMFFGYDSISVMRDEFEQFGFDDFIMQKNALSDIKAKFGDDVVDKVSLSKSDIRLIILMKKIIYTDDFEVLKLLIEKYLNEYNNDVDFYDDVSRIKSKIRLLMNYQFNSKLTNLDEKTSNASYYGDTGVKIIDFDGDKFNLLAHRLYSYDPGMAGFSERLMDDPSLWFKLEGATTLSCSSFSDKGFHFLKSYDPSGVVYLFNDLPEEFLLFMYGRDLYVEHGGFKLEPTAAKNRFTDIDGLNQESNYHSCSYNEVAGFRNGMVPCAFACIGTVPNQETIRAAKYFSQVLGKEIPIIRFDIKKYEEIKNNRIIEVNDRLKNEISEELLEEYFLNGIKVNDICAHVDYVTDCINQQYRDGKINLKQMLFYLTLCERLLNRGYMAGEATMDATKAIKRIEIFRQSLAALHNISLDEVILLENAKMGESGIMYKYDDKTNTYLLKPAIDKSLTKKEDFRTEVQVCASRLQSILNPDSAVKVDSVSNKKIKMSRQELIVLDDSKKTYLIDWVNNGGEIDSHILEQLLKEYVVDMLLCNFDCFPGNFVIDEIGNLRGIDKEQSFRFIDNPESLKADFSYVPNGLYRVPIYKTIFERYQNGEISIDFNPVLEVLENVKLITDLEYKELFRDYACAINPDNPDEILDKIVKRKHDVTTNIERYVEQLSNSMKAGEYRI